MSFVFHGGSGSDLKDLFDDLKFSHFFWGGKKMLKAKKALRLFFLALSGFRCFLAITGFLVPFRKMNVDSIPASEKSRDLK